MTITDRICEMDLIEEQVYIYCDDNHYSDFIDLNDVFMYDLTYEVLREYRFENLYVLCISEEDYKELLKRVH